MVETKGKTLLVFGGSGLVGMDILCLFRSRTMRI